MKIGSFNVHGLSSSLHYTSSLLKELHILFVIEHWLSLEDEHIFSSISPNHRSIFKSEFSEIDKKRGRPFGGSGWLISHDIPLLKYSSFNRHLSSIEVSLGSDNRTLTIFGIWLPFEDGKPHIRALVEVILSEILSSIESLDSNQMWLIIGDWNIERNKSFDRIMSSFLSENQFVSCLGRFDQLNHSTYRKGNYRARIDHIVCSEDHLSLVQDARILDSSSNLSDDNPIMIT